MRRGLLAVRVALAAIVVAAVATHVVLTMHERANVVDLEVLPRPAAPPSAQPVPVRPRDVPGKEVREQVDFYPRGGPGCAPPRRNGVALSVGFQGQAMIGLRNEICTKGFTGEEEVSLRIAGRGSIFVSWRRPDGVWSWNVPADALPGRYSVRAVQGSRTAVARIRVVTSPAPLVRIRSFLRSRTSFELTVAGGPRSHRAPVLLYRAINPGGSQRDYYSTIGVPTNGRGNGALLVRGTGGSTFTCYLVLPGFGGASVAGEDQFCFGSPDLG